MDSTSGAICDDVVFAVEREGSQALEDEGN